MAFSTTTLPAVRHWGWIVVLMAAVPTGADRIIAVRKELPHLRSKHASMIDLSLDSRFGDLPLGFEPNKGQADPRLSFLSRGQGYSLGLNASEAWIQLQGLGTHAGQSKQIAGHQKSTAQQSAACLLRTKFVGARQNAQVEGVDPLPGKVNYLIGSDPRKWVTGLPTFAKVKVRELYPGIDLLYYGNRHQLEFDLVVSPGADPETILLSFEGAESVKADSAGDLIVRLPDAEIRQHKPYIYQEILGARREITGGYVSKGRNEFAFQVGRYDTRYPLVVDPILSYSTYLAGNLRTRANDIATDAAGDVYVTGHTTAQFPTTIGAFQQNYHPNEFLAVPDAFVAKFLADGSGLVYATYLGGIQSDAASSLAVDGSGNAYLAGGTNSPDFPSTPGAFNRVIHILPIGAGPIFVAKLNPQGTGLVYSGFLGPGLARAIAVDSVGNAYVTGETQAFDFPTVNPIQAQKLGNEFLTDGFVTKVNASGSALVYSTYFGSSGYDYSRAIAVDALGSAYIAGSAAIDFRTTPNAYQTDCTSGGYVTKFNPAGNALVYSTCLRDLFATAIAIDGSGNAYVTGSIFPLNTVRMFPVTPGAFRTDCYLGGAAVTKLNASGTALVYSSCLGSITGAFGGPTKGNDIAVDKDGNAYVTGVTQAADFPTVNALQVSKGGAGLNDLDVFLSKINPSGSALVYSTFLGGLSDDEATAIALDSSGNVYLAGETASPDFPVFRALQGELGGGSDAFITRIIEGTSIRMFVPIVLSASGLNDSFYTSELILTNRGSRDATLEFTYTPAFGEGGGSASDHLAAGRQRVVPDAISYLKSIGVPISATGNRGGTLSVTFSGLSNTEDVGVTVRTTTAVSNGRAGLAYSGIPETALLTRPCFLLGLRQGTSDRTNVAIQNAGVASDGDIVLRMTVFSGDLTPGMETLPDQVLPPGGFKQFTGILSSLSAPMSNAYLLIEPVRGKAPYYAYAVVNDQRSSDGSFITPVQAWEFAQDRDKVVPAIVEANNFTTELIVVNCTDLVRNVPLTFAAETIDTPTRATEVVVPLLQPRQQVIIPNFVQWLREQGLAGLSSATTFAGSLFHRGSYYPVYLGARISAQGAQGGFGVFVPEVSAFPVALDRMWLYALKQDSESRTNVVLLNRGGTNSDPDVFRIDLFDGDTGLRVNSIDGIILKPRERRQFGSILAEYAPNTRQGYARIVRTAGTNVFFAFAVVNDGGQAGERTGDGAYVTSVP